MVASRRLWSLIALLALGAPAGAAEAVYHFRDPHFDIPITWGTGGQYKRATLYVSTDGQRFQPASSVAAGTEKFTYTAPGDGAYFFVLQLEDQDGQKWPPRVTADDISLRVFVDRKQPKITLRPTAPQDGTVAVLWKIEEDRALDLSSLRLEYSPAGRKEWTVVPIKPMDYAQRSWSPTGAGPFDVRLSVKDRAGNAASAETRVTPNAPRHSLTSLPGGGTAARREKHVNSKKFNLNYRVDKIGPSDIKTVEIWWTEDTRKWELLKNDARREGPVSITVRNEGLYGFTIRPVNGVGRGPDAPRALQEPQIWIRVDETKPRVVLETVVVREGADALLEINWTASDSHLRDKPITITYSADGREWKELKAGLENTGSYTHPTKNLPFEFHVRVEAVDQAGNRGAAQTKEVVKVDTSVPEVKDIGVSVDGKPDGPATPPASGGGSPAPPPPPLPGG